MGWTRATVLKVAKRTGYPVVEAWSGHNQGQMGVVCGPMLHHTGTSKAAAGDYPTLKIVRDGRSDLQNSLSMYGLGRSGTIYCISEKISWHAGAGNWNGVTDGNGRFAGIEAESDGSAASWTQPQLDSYAKLCASILLETGKDTTWMPRHADYALPKGRKIDTGGMDYNGLKTKVAGYLKNPNTLTNGSDDLTPDDKVWLQQQFAALNAKVDGYGRRTEIIQEIVLPGYGARIENTEGLVAAIAANVNSIAATKGVAATPGFTLEELARAVNDDRDRRDRDGNPKTGAIS